MDKTYSDPGSYSSEPGLKEKARQEAQDLAAKAKEQGREALAERKRATADEVKSVAAALRKTAQEMHQQEHPPFITPYAEQAANSLERFSNTLRERDLNSLVRQTENFARRQPGVFLGGAVVTGFLLARFFKSSELHSEYDYAHPSSGSSDTSYPAATGSRPVSSTPGSTTGYTPPPPPPSSTTTPASTVGARPGIPTAGTTTTTTQRKGEP